MPCVLLHPSNSQKVQFSPNPVIVALQKKMKLYTTSKQTNGTRTIKQGATDIQDTALFAFTSKLAPALTAIYNTGNDTKDTANLVCFVGDYMNCRAFVRAERVSNVYDARLAVLLAATEYFLAMQAMRTYASSNENSTLDVKSARAIAAQKLPAAYKNIIARAIDAGLFSDDTYLRGIAASYANGDYDYAPFAAHAIDLPDVNTRGIRIVASTRSSKPAAAIPAVEIDVDAALAAQFTPAASDAPAAAAN